MKFGSITRETTVKVNDHEITKEVEEKVIKGETIGKHAVYRESILVTNEGEALAEFLRLQDDNKTGRIKDYGLRCYTDSYGKIKRIEKLWKV